MSAGAQQELTPSAEGTAAESGPHQTALSRKWMYHLITLLVVVAFFLLWQFLPEWPAASNNVHFLSRFTISSPQAVAVDIWDLFRGSNGRPEVWTYLEHTVVASLLGALIGLALGVIVGVAFAAYEPLRAIFNPIVNLINSAPRVALIPIVVLLTGPTLEASIISAILVVFFLGFFNALEGASSVPQSILDNAKLMGAGSLKTVLYLRVPNALSLIFASLPNVISFSLITVVTTEILTGVTGMGALIVSSQTSLDSGLSLAVVVILAVVGAVLVYLAALARRKTIRWDQLR
jgi:NitT/TauT family transport system permease protein